MPRTRAPLFYERQVVGWITEPKVDMWFTYGRWEPADTPLATVFVEAVHAGHEPTVKIGPLPGMEALAMSLADEIMEVRSIPTS